MNYTIVIGKKAAKSIEKINDPDYSNIKEAILALAEDPRPPGCKKLKGREGFRIRCGDYRIIYDIIDHELKIYVLVAGHRENVYL